MSIWFDIAALLLGISGAMFGYFMYTSKKEAVQALELTITSLKGKIRIKDAQIKLLSDRKPSDTGKLLEDGDF